METIEAKHPFFYHTTVNRRVNPYLMKDEELWDMLNFWTEDTMGAKKVRPGLVPFLDRVDNNPVTGLFYAKFANGNVRLARVSGGKIYAVNPNSASVWGTSKYSTANSFVRPDYTVLDGLVHIVSRTSPTESHYIEWDNTDTMTARTTVSGTDLVVPFAGKTCVQYHQRVYVGGAYDLAANLYRSRLSWSVIDYQNAGTTPASPWTTNSNDISTAGYRDIDIDYRGSIIKLTNINDRINIYKEEGVYRYNESSVQEIFGVSPYEGSVATMEELQEDFFFTNEGFFKTDGKSITPIGDGWYPIIKQILRNGIDTSKVHSASVNFLYFCYLGDITYDGQTINNACFVYNSYYDEMYLWNFAYDITSIGHYVNSSGNKEIVLGDANGFTYKLDYTANDDSGQAIKAYFKSKYHFFDNPEMKDQLTEAYPFATQGSQMTVEGDADFASQYEDFMQIPQREGSRRMDYSKFGFFSAFSYKVVWNGKGERPEFYGIVLKTKETVERTQNGQ